MNGEELKKILTDLLASARECEWLEFKEAQESFDFGKLGKYFSALANEANLKGRDCGWLVFGVRDRDRKIVGTQYRANRAKLDKLKAEIANETTNRATFLEIHELRLSESRVIMFQIPAAPRGIPIPWKGHYYGREGESLNALSLQEIELIRSQAEDWSAKICPKATFDDLDTEAIAKAREQYKQKHSSRTTEVDRWDDMTFLNKARVTKTGQNHKSSNHTIGRGGVGQLSLPIGGQNNVDIEERE